MNTNTNTYGPIATLNLPKQNKALLMFAKAVRDAMKNNANFPDPDPTMATFEADINTFDAAETKAATRAKGSAAARDAAKQVVMNDLFHLCDYVQGVAEKIPNPANAAAVIESAFMTVKKATVRTKPELSAKNTGVPGEVAISAKSVGPMAVYYWEHSADQVTWSALPETLKASTTMSDLPWAKMHYFRFRTLTPAGKSDYSQSVGLLVQ